MSDFRNSNVTGKYYSGAAYTPFHKRDQDYDNLIGVSHYKASFWRKITYLFVSLNILFSAIFIFICISPSAPLKVIQVSSKGEVLFWGDLKTPPEILTHTKYNKMIDNKD